MFEYHGHFTNMDTLILSLCVISKATKYKFKIILGK